jgi:hypothetical protein
MGFGLHATNGGCAAVSARTLEHKMRFDIALKKNRDATLTAAPCITPKNQMKTILNMTSEDENLKFCITFASKVTQRWEVLILYASVRQKNFQHFLIAYALRC